MKIELGKNTAEVFTGPPVERDIAWAMHGEDYTATVFIRRMSYASAVGELHAYREKTEPVAARIASCVLDADGKPLFSVEDITGESDPTRGPLDAGLTWALLAAINEVNSLGKPTMQMSSGTNLSSPESVDEPLPKQKSA